MCLANQLLGSQVKEAVLELNASDDRCVCVCNLCTHFGDYTACTFGRGIDVVRNKIKMFAQKKVTLPPGRHKIVILDEADRLVLTILRLG
jgi:replication factor C subunit 2/4